MRGIEELRELSVSNGLTIEAVEAEIQERVTTIGHLVGWFYPDVLRSEISELYEILRALREKARPAQ